MKKDIIKSFDRGLRILEYIKEKDGATVDDIAIEFDISRSSVHRNLNTLISRGYVVRERNTNHLGLRFIDLGRYVKMRNEEFEVVEQMTKTLASQTEDRATYIVEENGIGIVIATETGDHGILADIHPGQQIPLHASAAGKAILAALPQAKTESILDRHGLQKVTENTITNREKLISEFGEIRQNGYSINRSERIQGINAVSVAVQYTDERMGAFVISGPTRRMTNERMSSEISETLLSAKQEFELRKKYND